MVATRSSNAPARPREELFSHPSEEELLARHLFPRVSDDAAATKQQPPRASFIHEADVYALGPAELTNRFAPAVTTSGDRAWYFFSAVRAKSREGQRKARTVDSGEGCWHSEAGAKPVVVVADQPCRRLGHRQSFSFVTKLDGRRVRSGWLMVELGIEGHDEMVLCKIYFSPRAHLLTGVGGAARATPAAAAARKRKAAAVVDDDDKNKNPAAPVLQRRHTYLSPEAASPPRANDDDKAGAGQKDDDTQDNDFDHTGSFLSLILDNREEFRARGYVDRTDEEFRAQLGLEEFTGLLDGAAKKSEGLLQLPPYDADRNSGYPACLTHEDLYSTEPLWFENFRRGYAGLNHNRRRRR